jgi:hypothetical protein
MTVCIDMNIFNNLSVIPPNLPLEKGGIIPLLIEGLGEITDE